MAKITGYIQPIIKSMTKKLRKKSIGLIILFTLITIVMVKASTPYSVTVNETNISAFPQVQLNLDINGNTDNLFARHFYIAENGERNHSPIILLPPKSPSNEKLRPKGTEFQMKL